MITARPTYFIDTSYRIAFIEAGDQHHARAMRWQQHVLSASAVLISSETVLWEVLNFFASPPARTRAIQLYRACHASADIEIAPSDSTWLQKAAGLYELRSDKAWSPTDCHSFELMRARGISQSLTADHHFQQAGFEALLLRDP